MVNSVVRLRFAPSPTGPLHIGGIRTALYNYLLAKKLGGRFILRIEDTDLGRYVPGAEQYIEEALYWVGLIPDEGPSHGGEFGPYRQSERKDIYLKYAQQLIENGHAFYAFDTPEEIEQMRNSGEGNQKYDATTRMQMKNSVSLSSENVDTLLKNGTPYVIRLKVPPHDLIEIHDRIRGLVVFNSSELDDKVLIKSDGMPTYHMANVIDDRLMKISHVIRGEEWLSSTAHHVLLYRAFQWEDAMPQFAHLPLILKPTGNGKLSKRDGAQFGFPVFPLNWKTETDEVFLGFREFGFEPDALLNFLALLGWNNGTEQELFSLNDLIHEFSIEKIVKSGARFDFEKGKWFNQQYLLQKTEGESIQIIQHNFALHQIMLHSTQAQAVYELYRDRVIFAQDYYTLALYLFVSTISYENKECIDFLNKKWKPEWAGKFLDLKTAFENIEEWTKPHIEETIKSFMNSSSLKMGDVLPSLRVMVSANPSGPDAFKMLQYVGKDKTINRISDFINLIEKTKTHEH